MTKAQLLFDPTAECEQFGFLPRGGDDLDAERHLIRLSRRRQGEHGKANQRDDKGDREVVDRCFEADIVDLRYIVMSLFHGKTDAAGTTIKSLRAIRSRKLR